MFARRPGDLGAGIRELASAGNAGFPTAEAAAKPMLTRSPIDV
jgi:hypothetical protein